MGGSKRQRLVGEMSAVTVVCRPLSDLDTTDTPRSDWTIAVGDGFDVLSVQMLRTCSFIVVGRTICLLIMLPQPYTSTAGASPAVIV